MAPRSSWKGFIRLSLVSVPVRAYSAAESGDGHVRLNMLHNACHSRIKYQKVCPIHGEVAADEIVSGYEYAKDQYVVIDQEELDTMRTEAEKAINIDRFVPIDAVDPLYYSGRTYYLLPDGAPGVRPYMLLERAMESVNRVAVAQAVLWNREQLVLLRPTEGLIAMSLLHFENQVRHADFLEDETPRGDVSADELKLAKTLIEQTSADEVALAEYHDTYAKKLGDLIQAKVAGQEVVTASATQEEVPVINLMDALRQSVAKAEGDGKRRPAAGAARKPAKKMAPSRPGKTAATPRKRKSS